MDIFPKTVESLGNVDLWYLSKLEHTNCAISFDLLIFKGKCHIPLGNEPISDNLWFAINVRSFKNWLLLLSNGFAWHKNRTVVLN